MRHLCCLTLLTLNLSVFSLSGEAQARLNFPRILSAQDLSTTGLAFVNTSSTAVLATFSFYGADGVLVGQNPVNVPAKGQVAKLASEILPNVKTSTWIQVSSSSTELQGFELVGDFATVVDGAGPAAESTQLAVIDFSREDTIYIVNPGSQTAAVQLTLNAANGSVLTTKSVSLTAFQAVSFRLGDLNNDDNIDLVSISSNVAVSATLTTKLPGGADVGVTNAVPTANAPSTFFFPFTPTGPQGTSNWKTLLGIANLASASQTVGITFNPDNGAPVTIQRNLSPGASVGDSVANLFSTPVDSFTAGWIRVTGTGPLAGAAAYQDSTNGSLAIVPSQSSGSTRFLFGHIASLAPWYTGIALLNTTSTAASVEVYAIEPTGQLVGSAASFTVAANSRRTALLSEFVSQVLQRASDGGWVFLRTTNNVPLLGFELFGQAIAPVLANVQGFALASTSTFAPPVGGTATSGVTIDQVRFTDFVGNPKTQFQPLDIIVYVTTIRNPSGMRGSAQLTVTLTDPRNQPILSVPTTITLPSSVSDFVYVGSIPSNALNGPYVTTAGLVTQGQLVTQSSGFDVTGGTSTPTAGQDPAVSLTPSGAFQVAFRPGDSVRFLVQMANFTGQSLSASINYKLTGPGSLNAGSGSLPFTMPTGISSQMVDMMIPSSAPQGLFAFTSTFTAGSFNSVKTWPISVVPKSSSEGITVENVFVRDSNRVPRGGFSAGSNIELVISTLSTFPLSTAATVRYNVTGPNSSSVLDQPLGVNIGTGFTTGFVPLSLSSNAAPGTYMFQGTITYQDVNGSPKTSTLSTTFTVGDNPPALKETITALHPNIRDINLVTRSSVSPAETLVFYREIYSTFAAPVSGTVRYQIINPQGSVVFDAPVDATFNPGTNVSFILITLSGSAQPGTYTLTTIANAQGQSSSSSTSFGIAGGVAPSINAVSQAGDKNLILIDSKSIIEFPAPLREVDDALEAIKK